MSRYALLVSQLALLAAPLGGCAHAPPRVAVVQPVPPPPPKATGVWDWRYKSRNEQGDERWEQEEWHLRQDGQELKGWYVREVTMVSSDEKLFQCNQRLKFTKQTRVTVAGVVSGKNLVLQETEYQAKRNECDDGARNLMAYVGTLKEGTIQLQWAPHTGQTLHRRDGVGDPGDVEGEEVEQASVPLDGTWEWELKSIDAEGDERVEHEEWHLTENLEGIGGYYERKVTRVRGDGVFQCNASNLVETMTRYTVSGRRLRDNKVQISETKFEVPTAAGPSRKCDNGVRRLDSYEGSVSGDGEELILSWGPGNQLLRRHR